MKAQRSKAQRRAAALEQAKGYTYANSKAKRNGVSEEKWAAENAARIEQLESIKSDYTL